MITSWAVLLDVALRTTVVYLALLVGLRLTGKRQLGQLSVFDSSCSWSSPMPFRTRWSAPTRASRAASSPPAS